MCEKEIGGGARARAGDASVDDDDASFDAMER